YPKKKKARIE
nr:Chain C, VP1 [Adeno-associated virus - Po1]